MADPSDLTTTQPLDADRASTARVTVVEAVVRDPASGATWVHKDLAQALRPWEIEEHLSPIRAHEAFGDVESWAKYVLRFTTMPETSALLTWNNRGLRAVLDYHHDDVAGRCQWIASYPFQLTAVFEAWRRFASNQAHSQRELVEWLEGHLQDVVEPSAGDLLQLLRTLRTNVNKTSNVALKEDGTSVVEYSGGTTAGARNGTTDLKPSFTVRLPVLKGHVGPAPDPTAPPIPVLYQFLMRLRVTVGDDSKPSFRLEIPEADRVLEDVYADRVRAAQAALGDTEDLLRGADAS